MNSLTNHMADSYNNKAVERDTFEVSKWKAKEREVFLQMLQKERLYSLLEIGAGPGKDSLYFNENGLATISTDLSPEMVRLCKEKGLDAKVMDFANLDAPDNYFDSVWAMNCLLHVPKDQISDVLSEIKRVLKPTGLFFMGVYGGENSEGIWEDDFYTPKRFFSFFEDEGIKQLVSEYFTIEYFTVVPKDVVGGKFHFQSMILRK
ncbi:class I SAM-dependent methyltransferase [Bacillus suaedaesalsae]|uniref:Class I SAM-dependent methyltransferase n=1 Tax=Bacillus suaedaesalsae TaxID=2810349 RepID=A0ABS2DHP4_9BACI|nr:class I SAM-dependent methyltransferase [Bacillus suaedaesalsae]MBM6618009.1 class I SAM-dependent methyltransferase [Bacillus suaedaesalsae]